MTNLVGFGIGVVVVVTSYGALAVLRMYFKEVEKSYLVDVAYIVLFVAFAAFTLYIWPT